MPAIADDGPVIVDAIEAMYHNSQVVALGIGS